MNFVWDPLKDTWEESLEYLKLFFREYGHSRVHAHYKTEDGFKLGIWVSHRRRGVDLLSTEQIKSLNELNFIWDTKQFDWDENYERLIEYFESNGHTNVPYRFKTEDGKLLGAWVKRQKQKKSSLSKEQIKKLNKLNYDW